MTMDEGTRLDLQFIRAERSKNGPHNVLRRAAELREYLRPHEEGCAEATVHMAWALARLGRITEALELYAGLIGQFPSVPLLVYMYAVCDNAVLLHESGDTEKANELMTQALALASESGDSQLIAISTGAAAKIGADPTPPTG